MSTTDLGSWRALAPKVYDESEATRAAEGRTRLLPALLDGMNGRTRRRVEDLVGATMASVICESMELDNRNVRQMIEEMQRHRIAQLRLEGQGSLLKVERDLRIRLNEEWMAKVAASALAIGKTMAEAQSSAPPPEVMATIQAAVEAALTALVATGPVAGRFDFGKVLSEVLGSTSQGG